MFIVASEVKIILHYFRFDENYEHWDVWVWPHEREGAAFPLTGFDDFGVKAELQLSSMSGSTKIGYLLRKGAHEWTEREYGDRYIEQLDMDNTAEIWIVQGDPVVYQDEAAAMAKRRKRIAVCEMTSPERIIAVLNAPIDIPEWSTSTVQLHLADGRRIEVRNVETAHSTTIQLETEQPLHITERYQLTIPGYGTAEVSIAGMFDHPLFEEAFTYQGDDLGASYSKDGTTFRLWAPTAAEAIVVTYSDWDAQPGTEIPMTRSSGGTWTVFCPGDLDRTYYIYKVRFGDMWNASADPYAKALSVNGLCSAVLDLSATHPDGWSEDVRPPFADPTDAVIYELHVRDATIHPSSGVKHPGTFAGLCEEGTQLHSGFPTGLNYFADLGVTHIQLLPVSDFVSVDEADPQKKRYNWGYDPAYYFAPEGSYAVDPFDPGARIRELKQLVHTFHRKGIRVVLDVVYNHLFSAERSNLGKLVPKYYFRYNEDGQAADGTGVGNDTASERAMMRKLIVDCVSYWAQEYHVDGFRFDLMGIHDIETMNQVRERLHSIDPSILVYGEGWVMNTPLADGRKANQCNAAALPGIGQFNDRMRDGLKGGVFDARERGFVNGQGARSNEVWSGVVGGIAYKDGIAGFAVEPCQTVNYVEVHDNHTLWDRLLVSNPDDTEEVRMRMHRLATAIVLTSQGIPFLHAGQEWFRTKHGEHNSYRSPDTINRIDWERAHRHRDTIQYVKGLLQLRKSHSSFRLRTADDIRERLRLLHTSPGVIAFWISGRHADDLPYEALTVAYNSAMETAEIDLPYESEWATLCSGHSAGVNAIGTTLMKRGRIPPLCAAIWGSSLK